MNPLDLTVARWTLTPIAVLRARHTWIARPWATVRGFCGEYVVYADAPEDGGLMSAIVVRFDVDPLRRTAATEVIDLPPDVVTVAVAQLAHDERVAHRVLSRDV